MKMNGTAKFTSSVTKLDKGIKELQDKIEVLELENNGLDDEIDMAKQKLKQFQKEYKKKQEQLKKIDTLLEEEKKLKQDLKTLDTEVASQLEQVEELESAGVLDEEATAEAMRLEREEKEKELQEIRKDLEAKLEELCELESQQATSSTE